MSLDSCLEEVERISRAFENHNDVISSMCNEKVDGGRKMYLLSDISASFDAYFSVRYPFDWRRAHTRDTTPESVYETLSRRIRLRREFNLDYLKTKIKTKIKTKKLEPELKTYLKVENDVLENLQECLDGWKFIFSPTQWSPKEEEAKKRIIKLMEPLGELGKIYFGIISGAEKLWENLLKIKGQDEYDAGFKKFKAGKHY